jgi:hypothetical protein
VDGSPGTPPILLPTLQQQPLPLPHTDTQVVGGLTALNRVAPGTIEGTVDGFEVPDAPPPAFVLDQACVRRCGGLDKINGWRQDLPHSIKALFNGAV